MTEWLGDPFLTVRLPALGAAETVDLADWIEAAMQQVEPVPAFVRQAYLPI